MKKILMISFRFPWPEWKGGFNLRVLKLAKILAKNYSIDFLTLVRTREEEKNVENLKKEEIFENIFYFYHPKIKEYKNAFWGFFSILPLQVSYYFSKRALCWLKENYKKYDLLYFNTIRTVKWGEKFKNIPKVVDLIDAVSLSYSEAEQYASPFWKMIYKIEIPRLKNFEKQIIKKNLFNEIFITSKFDKNYLLHRVADNIRQTTSDRMVVISNGVREELFTTHDSQLTNYKEENWISFVGKMDTQPNEDAVLWFAKEVFPLVKKVHKEAIFYIIGANPTQRVRRLGNLEGIRVTEFLEDPYEIIRRSKIVVAPLRFGAGVQNKILESMALGKAVLTSVVGERGTEGAESGKHFEVVPSFDSCIWRDKIIELWSNPERRKEIGKQARKLIEENYTWEKIGERLLKVIEGLIETDRN